MKSQYKNSLFIFRRDFRLEDNQTLNAALDKSAKVYPIFIFSPAQVSDKNDYRNESSIHFMIESLKELRTEIKNKNGMLNFFYGKDQDIIQNLINKYKIDAIFELADITPFSKERSQGIRNLIPKNVTYESRYDPFLLPIGTVMTPYDTAYKVYTPFLKATVKSTVPKTNTVPIQNNQLNNLAMDDHVEDEFINTLYKQGEIYAEKPGRQRGLEIIAKIDDVKKYGDTRNDPTKPTSGFGPHLKFGTVSIREVYWAAMQSQGKESVFIQQLWWREFYGYMTHFYFQDYTKKSFSSPQFNMIKWKFDEQLLQSWKDGKTGVPIVDAGMRQMNETGYMHNRLRMIVAMYLIYNLHQPWWEGEKYFAQKLQDYDYSNNYGGWVWCCGWESCANPYFRPFSMSSQFEKTDKSCVYVKKHVPELRKFGSDVILKWENNQTLLSKNGYMKQLVDCAVSKKEGLQLYQVAVDYKKNNENIPVEKYYSWYNNGQYEEVKVEEQKEEGKKESEQVQKVIKGKQEKFREESRKKDNYKKIDDKRQSLLSDFIKKK